MEKDKWIDDVINSSGELKRLSPRESLLQDIKKQAQVDNFIEAKTAWFIAASIIFIIAININFIIKMNHNSNYIPSEYQIDNPFSGNSQLY